MTDRKIEGRREDVEDARLRLLTAFGEALANVALQAKAIAEQAEAPAFTKAEMRKAVCELASGIERLSVGEAILRGEVLDIRKIINESTLDKRIMDHIDNRVMERASKLVGDALTQLEKLIEYEKHIDEKLRLLDAKIGRMKDLRKHWAA